jgi:hypothetical protein
MSYPFSSDRKINRTRKPHRCIWCSQIIEAGSAAFYYAGVWEGDFCCGHFHPECNKAASAVCEKEGFWEASGDYARGRTDDDTTQPPQFEP